MTARQYRTSFRQRGQTMTSAALAAAPLLRPGLAEPGASETREPGHCANQRNRP
jgi:hypothetical protein